MRRALSNILKGATDVLSQPDKNNPASVAGKLTRTIQSLPVKPPAKTTSKAQPAPQNTKATDESQNSEPKRIQFPSGVVAEVPGDWEPDALNAFASEVHAAAQRALGKEQ